MLRIDTTGSGGRRGFTLIEALVVMSIIMLLVALLLPGLRSARMTAQAMQCASNMRQLAQAMDLYADANDDWYPARVGASDISATGSSQQGIPLPPLAPARPPRWTVACYTQLRQISVSMIIYQDDTAPIPFPVLTCPSDEKPEGPTGNYPWYERLPRSFLFNGFDDAFYPLPFQWTPDDNSQLARRKILVPSGTALFGERTSNLPQAFYVDIFQFYPEPLLNAEQERHVGNWSNVAFADASVRAYHRFDSYWPVNLWAVGMQARGWWGGEFRPNLTDTPYDYRNY